MSGEGVEGEHDGRCISWKRKNMAVPNKVLELVERFDNNIDAYKKGKYNETQARREFIDPLFTSLGWDVDNEQGYAEAYKDVVHEDAIKIGKATKAPDYSFRIGGVRKFFVEAKKPSVDIKDDIHPAYQLRRYAWSAKLPLSILTDFEEFAVYDCRVKPEKTDKASKARVLYLTYTEYAQRWDDLNIFSREAILKGSFDKYAESHKAKRGTAEVDVAFLHEIERWRDLLARNIALRNPQLNRRELNFAVQRTIDRLIFLRICEDRGIEEYGKLMALQNGSQVYERMLKLFYQADDRYNSGIFHFKTEREYPEAPDHLTPELNIDDKVLKDILKNLYYPDSPYEFSVLSADILGQVYEQFLGKVIRLTAGHQAKVEEKPEVKKAGGVYYTPTYIVEYIVKHTVGTLLEGNTPKQTEKLRILDPACGSGSFLLGAYQYLLDWHRDSYITHTPGKWTKGKSPRLYQNDRGEWKLTIDERKRILLNNVYGVDIDSQAVEVTKLSLLLRVLEGEDEQTISSQMALFQKRVLPDLSNNIKCGNSLIGSDFYDGTQLALLDEEEMYRINSFDWKSEFSDIMQSGGFDVIIGNPPYIRIQVLKEWAPLEVEFYKVQYSSAGKGNYDIYVVFFEKGLSLLNQKGKLGYIAPHKFFNAKYGESLRNLLSKGKYVSHIVHFGHQQVFSGATTYTCLLFLDKTGSKECQFVKVDDLTKWRGENQATEGMIAAEKITNAEWNFIVGRGSRLFEQLRKMPNKLQNIADRMAQGIRTSANDIYVLDIVSTEGNIIEAYSKQLARNVEIESKLVSLFLQGREIKPYRILPSGKIVIIPYQIDKGVTRFIPEKEIEENFPKTFTYLLENKRYLENREKGRMRGLNWYAYVYPKNIEVMSAKKILIPDIADRASFALDETGEYAFTSGYAITLKDGIMESQKYILGLLNSKVLDFYLKNVSTTLRGGFFRYFTQFIEQLPIYRIDFSNTNEKARHDQMVGLVERMLDLHKQQQDTKMPQAQTLLKRQIEATDRQINKLVYELYGLTEEEIKIVETS